MPENLADLLKSEERRALGCISEAVDVSQMNKAINFRQLVFLSPNNWVNLWSERALFLHLAGLPCWVGKDLGG